MTRVPTIASVTLLRALSKSVALATILLSGSALSHGQDKSSAVISTSIDVRPEDLLAQPPGANWVSYNGDYTGRRFSNLAQITAENVGNLRTQWIFHLRDSTGLEVTPVAVDGILFVTSANDAFALDARTGRAIWHYSRPITEGLIDDASQHHNRGVAIWHSKVFLETDNAHLVCLDARSGHLLWDAAYAVGNKNYGATSAPLVVKDKVIVGTSGGDDGVRGFVAAFDAETGKEAWRLWTIPGPGEFGSDSWPGDLYLRGGGTTWMPGTYDPGLNTIYWGTSNAAPDFDGGPRPGDDLYTACVLAIDPDTGKMKWYFQFTPHDLFDWDATEILIAFDETVDGKRQRLLAQADRNGFYYLLDRENGHFLRARAMVKQDWAQDIDAQGRPVRNPGALPTPEGTTVFPSVGGATNWMSPSYSPITGLVYVPVREWGGIFYSRIPEYHAGDLFTAGSSTIFNDPPPKGIIRAFDASTGELRWEYNNNTSATVGGLLCTKGGVVFGSVSQAFVALDAKTGHELWRMETGGWIKAAPVTYTLDGKQMVTIAAGHDILTFGLE